jgi:hypothetical protein
MTYLEQLKTQFSVKGHPRLLTKPTKVPSVSFVSAPGWHVSKHEGAEDPAIRYWSDVVHARFWVAPTTAQAVALMAQGEVAYVADEIWRLRDLKARNPQSFTAKLRAIHQAKTIFGATIVPEATQGTVLPVTVPAPP